MTSIDRNAHGHDGVAFDGTLASKAGCFIAGTSVWTEAGKVAIESIKPGDKVLSRPEEGG
ncbi:Hint domain-containing protein [Xanthomonas hortorum]|uniref:Hint domain-containing protein n=1 Tax=Xanthomonas hortorum TaxID=56454 RepID=UPI0015948E60|nr:Hint domain-containing protein [Xanthomonas hortorum]NHF67491.1 hypothetical protein [Xanthomonas hortorum]